MAVVVGYGWRDDVYRTLTNGRVHPQDGRGTLYTKAILLDGHAVHSPRTAG